MFREQAVRPARTYELWQTQEKNWPPIRKSLKTNIRLKLQEKISTLGCLADGHRSCARRCANARSGGIAYRSNIHPPTVRGMRMKASGPYPLIPHECPQWHPIRSNRALKQISYSTSHFTARSGFHHRTAREYYRARWFQKLSNQKGSRVQKISLQAYW